MCSLHSHNNTCILKPSMQCFLVITKLLDIHVFNTIQNKLASVCNHHIIIKDLHVKIIIWSLRLLKVQSYHGTRVYVLVLVSSNVCILQVNSSCLKRCRQYAQLVLLNNIAMLSLGKAGSVFQLIKLTNKHINGIRRQL